MALLDKTAGARLESQKQLLVAIDSMKRFELDNKLHELVSNEAEFYKMLTKISGMKAIGSNEKKWAENRSLVLNTQGGYWKTGSATDFAADTKAGVEVTLMVSTTSGGSSYASLRAGDLIQVVDSDDPTLTATLQLKSVSSNVWTAYLLNNAPGFNPAVTDKVHLYGSAFGENGAFTTGSFGIPDTRWMSTQIFKDMVSYSRNVEEDKDVLTGNEVDRLLRDAMQKHYADIDRTLMFAGYRITALEATGTTNPYKTQVYDDTLDASGNRVSHTASFKQIMDATTNRDVSLETRLFNMTAASYDLNAFIDDMEKIFKYGSKVKESVCGYGVVSFFNKLAAKEQAIQMNPGKNIYGINVTELVTPHGTINLKPSRGMSDHYNMSMALIDPSNIDILTLHPTTWGGLPKTRDGKDVEILTELGLQVRLPETHAWVNIV